MKLLNIKIAFHTLGCKVNSYETEVMEQKVKNAGAEVVPFTEKADVYVVNTCSVTNIADRKSRQMLHKAKKENPDAVICAAGCYVQVEDEATLHETGVDLIIDNDKKSRVAELIEAFLFDKKEAEVENIGEVHEFESMVLESTSEHTRAYLKIQDGCNQFCTYCIIPYARGRIRSKKQEEVLEEVRLLTRNGVKEFVLTGIHLPSYGLDFEEKDGLISLIEEVAKVPGVERIRLGSLEPRVVTEEFAKRLSKVPKICPHFHLSLQSGSADTLKRMNRHYTPEEYYRGCEILRAHFDHPAITTDVIVGFPGETEETFTESLSFVEKANFYEMHIFKYSRRKGTVADRMPNQLTEKEKAARSEKMIALGNRMSADFRKVYEGRTVSLLTEEDFEFEGQTYKIGYTKEYIRAVVPKETPVNTVVYGRLTGYLTNEIMIMTIE